MPKPKVQVKLRCLNAKSPRSVILISGLVWHLSFEIWALLVTCYFALVAAV